MHAISCKCVSIVSFNSDMQKLDKQLIISIVSSIVSFQPKRALIIPLFQILNNIPRGRQPSPLDFKLISNLPQKLKIPSPSNRNEFDKPKLEERNSIRANTEKNPPSKIPSVKNQCATRNESPCTSQVVLVETAHARSHPYCKNHFTFSFCGPPPTPSPVLTPPPTPSRAYRFPFHAAPCRFLSCFHRVIPIFLRRCTPSPPCTTRI